MDLHRLALVIENIQLPFETDFSVSLRLCNSDWCSAGTFHQTILPVGVTSLFNPTEDSLKLAELPVDMKIKAETGTFSGTLSIVKAIGTMDFIARGSTVLYKEDATVEVLMLSLLLSVEMIRPPPPPQLADNEAQTEVVAVNNVEMQAIPPSVRDQNIETEARVLRAEDLKEVVIKVVRRNLRRSRQQKKVKTIHPPDPTPPPVQEDLGFNVLPRLQKLSMLNQMITNRERLLAAMTNTVQHSELRRKMEFIKSQRRVEVPFPVPEIEAKPVVKKVLEEREEKETKEESKPVKEVEEIPDNEEEYFPMKSPFNDNSSSSIRESDSEKSEITTTFGTDSGSVSGSELSTESSNVSVKAALPPKRVQASSSSSIEDPFSPRSSRSKSQPASETKSILSPTSQYIQNLRAQIIRERMAQP